MNVSASQVAIICEGLRRGEPVKQVVVRPRNERLDIQVLCGGTHSDGSCPGHAVCLDDALKYDPSVSDKLLLDSPVPYRAHRERQEGEWLLDVGDETYLWDEGAPYFLRPKKLA
jgi:hypothetical protein